MIVITSDGTDIYCLPDCAKCLESGESPLDMDRCPLCAFDDWGEMCIPDICDRYTEEDEHDR